MSQQEILHHHASNLINGLREKSQQKDAKINMCLWFDSFGLDVISDLIYGQSFNCLHSKGSPTRETDMIASSFKASTWYRAIRRMPGLVQVIIKAMLPKEVVRKRQIRMQYSIQKIRERMQRPSERPDVYHFISGSGDSSKMSADEMASSISVLLGAGSETTATTLCGCIYFLLQSPGVFQQLQSEIVQQFQTEEEITWNKLNSIRFLTAVIDETMRLYPPTPSTLQRRVPAVGATIAGKSIPPGTIVGVNHYVAHRSPRHFVNATEWTPKRWLGDEAFEADDKSAFRPFLLGPRNCVGQK
jgi:cytochrome P450